MNQQSIRPRSNSVTNITTPDAAVSAASDLNAALLARAVPGTADELVSISSTLHALDLAPAAPSHGLMPTLRRVPTRPTSSAAEQHPIAAHSNSKPFGLSTEKLPSYEETLGLLSKQPTDVAASTSQTADKLAATSIDIGALEANVREPTVAAQDILGIHPHLAKMAYASAQATAAMASLQLFTIATLLPFEKLLDGNSPCKNDLRPMLYTSFASALLFVPGILLSGKITRNKHTIEAQASNLRNATAILNQLALTIAELVMILKEDPSADHTCLASSTGQVAGPIGLLMPTAALVTAGAVGYGIYAAGCALASIPAAVRATNDYRRHLFSDMDSLD